MLSELFPIETRKTDWRRLSSEIPLPSLVRPAWMVLLLHSLVLLSFIAALINLRLSFPANLNAWSSVGFAALVAIVIGYSGFYTTRPFKKYFRIHYALMSDLVEDLMFNNPNVFKKSEKAGLACKLH
jgi:hypothetical protein